MLQWAMENRVDKESYLIDRLGSSYIGDDAAVVGEMLYSMDAFFEDVHFKRSWMSMEQIAQKAMLVNISDAIAMGAKPLYALVTLSIPYDLSLEDIDRLREALEQTAKAYGCEIIGGDTVGSNKLHLSITIISTSANPLLRSGLQEGDLLAYTGHLGQSKRDLEALFRGEKIADDSRFFKPTLRQAFIEESREYLRVGMDISDGLFCDTNKLLQLNNYGLEPLEVIEEERGLSGEEYEMLVGFDPEHKEAIEAIAKRTNTPLTIFARATKSKEEYYLCKSHHFKG
jgi:thiamine-monophosphate kinase